MASTTFVDYSTPIVAAWLNDVNTATYTTVPALRNDVDSNISDILNLYFQKADDSAVVHKTATTETIAGTKTFSTRPIVGTASLGTSDTAAASTAFVQSAITYAQQPAKRQTVINGPSGAWGQLSLGGSIGSTTVTGNGTITVSAAYGPVDYTASITNPSWTGLSTNGTMFLYVDINTSTGVASTGSTTVTPVYTYSNVYSTSNNLFTFSAGEMIGKVGNGSTVTQVARVMVGEVTVSGGVVATISWYALRGKAMVALSTLPSASTKTTQAHNVGLFGNGMAKAQLDVNCATAELGYSVGDIVTNISTGYNSGSYIVPFCPVVLSGRNSCDLIISNSGLVVMNKTTFASNGITLANWTGVLTVERTW